MELRLPIRDIGLRERRSLLDWRVQHDAVERGRMHRLSLRPERISPSLSLDVPAVPTGVCSMSAGGIGVPEALSDRGVLERVS